MLQNMNFYCSINESKMESFSEKEQQTSNQEILFADTAPSRIGSLLQAVYTACNWILGGKGIMGISPEGIPVTCFYAARSILHNLLLHRTAWQRGKADTASVTTCCNVRPSGHQYWCDVTSYDKVGSSYQKSVFWRFIHFCFFKLGGS